MFLVHGFVSFWGVRWGFCSFFAFYLLPPDQADSVKVGESRALLLFLGGFVGGGVFFFLWGSFFRCLKPLTPYGGGGGGEITIYIPISIN